jgi:hypothetical protein
VPCLVVCLWCGQCSGLSRLFSTVEHYGSLETTPKEVLVPASSFDMIQHVGFVPARSLMLVDVGDQLLPRPVFVLTTVTGCFPQFLLGLSADFLLHPSWLFRWPLLSQLSLRPVVVSPLNVSEVDETSKGV